ncbi:unnamed protein product [Rotaria socialis]|uniref:Uncharacterized protein n=5 Tax=Rotaria TaxID=231623 RepID=A0A817W7E9_9BILA|nr:unnamed protein product [Rotaria socialis]CAF4584443.1 unnamed protein product [Rotaria socialis]
MFQLDVLIDISILPSNIMALRDDDFIDFVKEEAGHAAAALLEIQGINCVKSLLMTDNVYAIMNVKSKSLDGLKNKYGYMQDDGTFVIQPGVKGNIEYLIDLLKKKCIEDVKLAKSSKHNQSSSSLTIPKSTSTVTSNNTTEKTISVSFNSSVAENKTYIIDTLNNWCENNKSKLNVQQFTLVEGEHYFILMQNDSNGALKCDIRCCCQKWSSLPLRRGKFQLSNFYRHLQGLNNICPALRKMIINPQSALPSSTNNPPPLITSDNVPQQVASPNQIPIISPSDTIQSNSALSTASSTSISTDNDESLMQQSSSVKPKRPVKRKIQIIESSRDSRESTKRTRRR